MLMISMGPGTGCDAQYLFAEDILDAHRGHYPRHARKYRDFPAEYEPLQRERIAAFAAFAGDVATGRFPAETHVVGIVDDEFAAFERRLAAV